MLLKPNRPATPEFGTPQEILPHLYRLRMPLPFELSHVNLWLLQGDWGWTIIDTGFNYGDTLAHWEKVRASLLADKPVENILITHFHPDHFGLAGYLCAETDVVPHMTAREYAMAQSLMDTDKLQELYTPYYIEAGLDGELLAKMIDKRLMYKNIVSTPPAGIQTLALGDMISLGGRDWRVTGGGGHSPEHACFYNVHDKIFIAGDIVLPGITPNISYFPGNGPAHDPLADYFVTLARVRADVPDDVLVLPSHGDPFTGLHARIAEIHEHHERRLDKVRDLCRDKPQTALEVMNGLFSHRKLSSADLFFALGETLAHLVHDEKRGRLRRDIRDGVAFYSVI